MFARTSGCGSVTDGPDKRQILRLQKMPYDEPYDMDACTYLKSLADVLGVVTSEDLVSLPQLLEESWEVNQYQGLGLGYVWERGGGG